MSVDITTESGDTVDIPNVAWRFALEFARLFGWAPLGTLRPTWYDGDEQWKGQYDPALGQSVSADDAKSFGEAIMRGLDSPQLSNALQQVTATLTEHAASLGYVDGPAAVVDDGTIDMLREVSKLVRGSGGFSTE